MEKPSRKLKKILLIVGVTGAVFLSFKYLLPLVIPFLIAYGVALVLRPSVLWLADRARYTIKGRSVRLPLAVIGGAELFIIMVLVGSLLYVGGRKVCMESSLFLDNLPEMISGVDHWLTSNCFRMENFLHLQKGSVVRLTRDMLVEGGRAMKTAAMPFLMNNSMNILRCFIEISVMAVVLFISTILTLQEMDDIRMRRDNSMFRHEFAVLGQRLASVGIAWLKTQGSIMLITTVICITGLFLLGNPYSILLGIGIGLLDALPIFGTGTVLLPWALFSALTSNWLYAIGLLLIYIISYFLREIMETKVMGDKVGLTPLETLISMYVGLQLFGLLGFILGPIGLLIIEDVVELYSLPHYARKKTGNSDENG